MNLKYSVLALLCIINISYSSQVYQPAVFPSQVVPVSNWKSYETMVAGAVLGASMGALNYATDLLFPLNWLCLSMMRNMIIDDLVETARNKSQAISAPLIENSAWISDWAAYLLLYRR